MFHAFDAQQNKIEYEFNDLTVCLTLHGVVKLILNRRTFSRYTTKLSSLHITKSMLNMSPKSEEEYYY